MGRGGGVVGIGPRAGLSKAVNFSQLVMGKPTATVLRVSVDHAYCGHFLPGLSSFLVPSFLPIYLYM